METLRELLKIGSLKIAADAAAFSPLAVFRVCLPEEKVSFANASFTALTGYKAEELPADGGFWRVLFGEAEAARVLGEMAAQLDRAGRISLCCRLCHKDGGALWTAFKGGALWKSAQGVYLECLLLPKQRREAAAVSAAQERQTVLEEKLQCAVFDWNLQTGAIAYSPAFEKHFGYRIPDEETLVFLESSDCVYEDDKPTLRTHFDALRAGAPYSEAEYRVKSKGGRYVWCKSSASALLDESARPVRAIGLLAEIEAYKAQAIAFREQACRDKTTGLLNKAAFVQEAQVLLAASEVRSNALLLLDLDDFKRVNEYFGRAFGDKVLGSFAQAIAEIFAPEALCGRFGGGTCFVFLPGASRAQAENKIQQFFTRALQRTEKNDFLLRCCIGGAVGGQRAFEALLDRADVALYEAKAQGTGRYILL